MRVEVHCVKCKASVLVLEVKDGPIDRNRKRLPDAEDLVQKTRAAGWTFNKQGPVCTEKH